MHVIYLHDYRRQIVDKERELFIPLRIEIFEHRVTFVHLLAVVLELHVWVTHTLKNMRFLDIGDFGLLSGTV